MVSQVSHTERFGEEKTRKIRALSKGGREDRKLTGSSRNRIRASRNTREQGLIAVKQPDKDARAILKRRKALDFSCYGYGDGIQYPRWHEAERHSINGRGEFVDSRGFETPSFPYLGRNSPMLCACPAYVQHKAQMEHSCGLYLHGRVIDNINLAWRNSARDSGKRTASTREKFTSMTGDQCA